MYNNCPDLASVSYVTENILLRYEDLKLSAEYFLEDLLNSTPRKIGDLPCPRVKVLLSEDIERLIIPCLLKILLGGATWIYFSNILDVPNLDRTDNPETIFALLKEIFRCCEPYLMYAVRERIGSAIDFYQKVSKYCKNNSLDLRTVTFSFLKNSTIAKEHCVSLTGIAKKHCLNLTGDIGDLSLHLLSELLTEFSRYFGGHFCQNTEIFKKRKSNNGRTIYKIPNVRFKNGLVKGGLEFLHLTTTGELFFMVPSDGVLEIEDSD